MRIFGKKCITPHRPKGRLDIWCLVGLTLFVIIAVSILLGVSVSKRRDDTDSSYSIHTMTEDTNEDSLVEHDYVGIFGSDEDADNAGGDGEGADVDEEEVELVGKPKATLSPTAAPTFTPSFRPSGVPSADPSSAPSAMPSAVPSSLPSSQPSESPTNTPSDSPSESTYPSFFPTLVPSISPSVFPSVTPSALPSSEPSSSPSMLPSIDSSAQPSNFPSKLRTPSPTESPVAVISISSLPDESVETPTPPTDKPTSPPTTSPTTNPTKDPTRNPTENPTKNPTPQPTTPCFTFTTYDSIDNDIKTIKTSISDNSTRSHFLGGIVRLAAHDFMDYDLNEPDDDLKMGSDGCFDPDHTSNAGLPESVWCSNCTLTLLYEEKYSQLSRADFWIASANAVIRQTSIDNALDLKESFVWGRVDREECAGSGDRLPRPTGCQSTRDVFLERMGLEWRDAVALMGAHTLGRGHEEFSGHHGTWVDDEQVEIFDKTYFEELYRQAWIPRNRGTQNQDWTRGNPNDDNPKMMLNTDMCLVFDIDKRFPCCSRTDTFYSNGSNRCGSKDLSEKECRAYDQSDSRWAATEAVREYLGGTFPNSNNEPFYTAFASAWSKATTNGWENLSPLAESCEQL